MDDGRSFLGRPCLFSIKYYFRISVYQLVFLFEAKKKPVRKKDQFFCCIQIFYIFDQLEYGSRTPVEDDISPF